MHAKNKKSLQTELRRLRRKHSDLEMMELLVADMHGVLKGKRIRPSDFAKTMTDGFPFCAGTVLLSTLGEVISGMPFGPEDGDPDYPCAVVPGSLAPMPWTTRPSAQGLFRIFDHGGEPFFADPRTVLERALAPVYKKRLKIVMATELEFYLLDGNADRPTPRGARVPGIGRPQPGAQVYHPDDLVEIEPFLQDVYDYCAAQRIPADTAIAEYAPGQFEINLRHIDDPVLACDHAVLLKRVVKAAARKHGFVACFMAKPFAGESGSGLHLHMSLVDRNGVNYFSKGRDKLAQPPYSANLRHAIGGMLDTMADATAIFAPNANSYRRILPDQFAPVEPNWGPNHRAVALRIPLSDAKNLRIEHRVAGADANPYLVTAAVVAGLHHGLSHRSEPPRMVEESEVLASKVRIPDRWDKAIDRFARSTIFRDYLGAEYCRLFVRNRRAESQQFHEIVSPIDFDWYLRAV